MDFFNKHDHYARTPYWCADLASRLHRLAKGCQRASIAECNGELHEGQRDDAAALYNEPKRTERLKAIDAEVAEYCERINKQVAKLSEELEPFGLACKRDGDPRVGTLKLFGEGLSYIFLGTRLYWSKS